MTKNNKWLLLLCFSIAFFKCYSQGPSIKGYVVITYEQRFARGFEGIKRTFWIVPLDSISSTETKFCPLLLSGSFKNEIDSCCMGKEIDPNFSSPSKENYLDTEQENALDILQTIAFTKRKKIQTMIKKWSSGNQEKITISATSVFGSFCFCKFNFTGQKRSSYSDLLYIPYSQIEGDEKFWNTSKSKLFMNFDLSKYDFIYNVLYNVFPEWRKYGK